MCTCSQLPDTCIQSQGLDNVSNEPFIVFNALRVLLWFTIDFRILITSFHQTVIIRKDFCDNRALSYLERMLT